MNTAKLTRIALVLCAVALAAAAGCSKKPASPSSALKDADSILRFVPADSPYVFAAVEPVPEDVADKLESQNDALLKLYGEVLSGLVEESTQGGGGDPGSGLDDTGRAVIGEIARLMSTEKIREAGIGREAQAAIYGVGLLPVIRVSLTDAEAFEDTIAQIEAKSDGKMSVGSAEGASYRYVGDDEGRILLAIVDDHAVVTFVPASLPEAAIAAVLGVTLPDQSIADSGALAELSATYDFTAHGLGFVDIQRITRTFLDKQSGVNGQLLAMMEYDVADVSARCRAEALDMAAVAPRLVAGYTKLAVDEFRSNTALELRNDIAKGLAALAAPVNGLGMDHGGLFSFGMSFDLLAARKFYEARLDALAADPYECEWFAEMQSGLEQGREAMNQPLPPIAYGVKGFVAVIDNVEGLDFATQQPPTDIQGRVLVATGNAPGLLAMGAMFSPELAALDLKPDGKPVELALPPNPANLESAFVAVTDASLGIAMGDDAQARLSALLDSPVADPPPFMSMNMDAARYYSLIGESMTMDLPQADDDPGHSPPSAQMMETVSEVMTQVGEVMERMSVDVVFTERGIEMPSTMTLAD